jgi:hypothetical protein
MRVIDTDRKHSVRSAQIYLTVREAQELYDHLEQLLNDPEASEHFHVIADDASREISYSILTSTKLAEGRHYTNLERSVFAEK